MADSTQFTVDVEVPAAGMSAAAEAAQRLAAQLEAAGAASTAATEAVKAGEAAYKQAETTASRAALAVEKIGLAADAQRGKLQAALDTGDQTGADRAAAKLQNLLTRQSEAKAKADAAAAAMNAEAASLDRLKTAAAAADATEAKLEAEQKKQAEAAKAASKAQKANGDAAEGASLNMRALSGALGHLGGPLGTAGQQVTGMLGAVQKLGKSLGAVGPYVAAVVAIFAIATAAAVATAAILKFGIANADAARTSALLSDGVAGSVAGGRQLDDTIHKLQGTVPQTRDELLAMAGDLAKTGLKGDALSAALETAAVKAAKLKYGPEFAKQTLSLTNQAARLRDNISGPQGIFSGLKIEGLLTAISHLVALFDSTSASGKAIKVVFESLFQPIIDALTKLEPQIVATFIQLEIWALRALIAIKPYGSQIVFVAKVLGAVAAVIVGVVVAAFVVLAAASAAFATVLALIIDGLVTTAGYLYSGASAVYNFAASITGGAGAALDWLLAKFNEVTDFLSSIDLGSIGTAMIEGLIAGITGAGGGVLTAMTDVVSGAVDSAKKLLGIASPSKVFAEIGMNTAAGMTEGVQDSAGDVHGAIADMIAPPVASVGAAPAASAGKGKKDLSGATIIFNGVKGAEDALDLFLGLLEGEGDQAGVGEPA